MTEDKEKKGWLARLRAGLSRTSSRLSDGIGGIFTGRKLDDDALEELEDLLITSDLGVETAARLSGALARTKFDKEVSANKYDRTVWTGINAVTNWLDHDKPQRETTRTRYTGDEARIGSNLFGYTAQKKANW
ncbi:MAG: DUF932 domain-containing protein [Alphaproteobacteria bacterium]|nr:DUF932 domain-containing protein [Alphaproteobacteria bacterium]